MTGWDFKPALKSMLNTVQESFLIRSDLPLGRQTHGAVKSRSQVVCAGQNEGIFKLTYMRQAAAFIKEAGEAPIWQSSGRKRESEREMANWPFPDGIAFNPYYRVLLGTCRLEKSDKSGSNATVYLHFYSYFNKKRCKCFEVGPLGEGCADGRTGSLLQ